MRIVASNPDSIGDFVLRQPLYAAIAEAGHELLLVVRSFVAPIAPLVAPSAQIVHLGGDPYSPSFAFDTATVENVIGVARAFAPDVVCIAPYQRTQFDEYLVKRLPDARSVGFAGFLFRGPISSGLDLRSEVRFHQAVAASADCHELRKNELLCSALLGRNINLPRPRLEPGAAQLEAAAGRLAQLGLTPHAFWVACVGHNEHTAVRNWGREQWAPALSALASHYGQRLVFLGSPDENEVTEEIRRLMGEHAHSCVNLCDAGDGLDTTVGLVHQSSGYIGRDTGPMHIAAAMDKPVIAVFGGGTWPRFIPAAGRGVVQTVNVPCAGCDWMCHLSESYCVKRVPASAVIDAIAALKRNPEAPLSIQVLAPDEFLSARLVREAAENAREEKRRSAARERALEGRLAQHQAHERSFAELEAGNAELTREIEVRQEAYERVSAELAARNADFEALVQRRDVERHYLRLEREDWAKTQARAEAQIQDLLGMAQELKRQTELSTVEPVGAQQGLLSSSIPRRGVGVLSAMVMVLTRIRAARGRRLAEMRTLAGSFLLLVRTRLRLTHK